MPKIITEGTGQRILLAAGGIPDNTNMAQAQYMRDSTGQRIAEALENGGGGGYPAGGNVGDVIEKTATGAKWSEAVTDLKSALGESAPLIHSSSSGSLVHIEDGADDRPMSCKIYIEPMQSGSGDPAPDNVRPITGWTGAVVTRTGRNLLDITKLRQGSLDNPTSAGNVCSDTYFPIKGGMSYVWSTPLNPITGRYVRFYDASKTNIEQTANIYGVGSKTFTAPQDACYFKPMWYLNTGITPSDITADQIEPGSTATPYEPYTSSTYPISWSASGTIYGGSVDMDTGVMTVTHGQIASYNGETLPGKWISDRDVYAVGTTPTTGAQVVYELATPLTIQLSPVEIRTLYGVNNIWADTGDCSITYPADTKLYIQELTKPTEDDLIANANIASGAFFMIGNTLYKATAAIANGATITPGTNATKLSLADALNLLNS